MFHKKHFELLTMEIRKNFKHRKYIIFSAVLYIILISSCPMPVQNENKPQGYLTNEVSITINGASIRDLNPLFFGFNYWLWPDAWGYNINHTETLSRAMKIRFMRAGGINNDAEIPQTLSDAFQTRFGEYCRTNNAQALLQVPVISHTTIASRIDYATNLIRSYLNKGYPLNYVSIGNEPDGYSGLHSDPNLINTAYLSNFSVNDYINTFTNMSAAIRAAFPGIKIVGLELGWQYSAWIAPFVSACRSYMDILSIHRYAFWPVTSATYSAAKGEFDALSSFYSSIRSYAPDLPLIIGEMNSSADGDPMKPASDAMPGTFNAALWLADNIGVTSRESNFVSLMPWSICEGWRTGFITAGTLQPKPSYYSYLLFSNYAKNHLIHIQKVNSDLRIYAYKDDSGNVSVFFVNWGKNAYQNVSISFNGILGGAVLTNMIEPWSLTCLDLANDMSVKKAYIYSSRMANTNGSYQETNF